jgi:hypothetical protein
MGCPRPHAEKVLPDADNRGTGGAAQSLSFLAHDDGVMERGKAAVQADLMAISRNRRE